MNLKNGNHRNPSTIEVIEDLADAPSAVFTPPPGTLPSFTLGALFR